MNKNMINLIRESARESDFYNMLYLKLEDVGESDIEKYNEFGDIVDLISYIIRKQDKIEFAKNILENYQEMLEDYEKIIVDEKGLVQFSELLEEKMMEDNANMEIDAITELFKVKEDC
jgi:hypothetical protein